MKNIFILILLLISTVSLSACKTVADTRNDQYSIETNDNTRNSGTYRHCPPGHAKKGWC